MTQATETQNPMTGMVETTGDMIKSVGRFSLAMSLFAARQATSMFSDRPGASLDGVSKAARAQLSGMVGTAFAVGTNVQAGVVDLAFDMSGMRPRGQAPTGPTTALSIPIIDSAKRRVAGVQTVASGALKRPIPQEEFARLLKGYHTEATAAAAERAKTVVGLWKSEGLSTSVPKNLLPENTLNRLKDSRLPLEALPIAHVGFGSGSTEEDVFDVAKLNALFEERCDPNFIGFSYEGIGAIIRMYERGFFKVMSGALDLIRLDAPDGPDATGFYADYLKQFPRDIQRLITHGYGRIVAFSSMNIYSAIEEATTYPPERVEPAVHGAGFAFAYMNSADLPRILEQSAIPFDSSVRAAFQNGLIYALVFFEWYAPGLLADWKPVGDLEAKLIKHARHEAQLAQDRTFPFAFRLENPRTGSVDRD